MKIVVVLVGVAIFPCAMPASDRDRPKSMTQQPNPIAGVQEAVKQLKPGMDQDAVMRLFPVGSLNAIGFPVTTPAFVHYSYDLGHAHSLTLEFDPPPPGLALPMNLARAVLLRDGRTITKVGK